MNLEKNLKFLQTAIVMGTALNVSPVRKFHECLQQHWVLNLLIYGIMGGSVPKDTNW